MDGHQRVCDLMVNAPRFDLRQEADLEQFLEHLLLFRRVACGGKLLLHRLLYLQEFFRFQGLDLLQNALQCPLGHTSSPFSVV